MLKTKMASRVIFFLISFILIITLVASEQHEEEQTQLFWNMINIIVENNSSLISQRSLIEEVQKMPKPGEGFISIDEITTVSSDKGNEITAFIGLTQVEDIRNRWLLRKEKLENARQKYDNMKKNLISELSAKVTEISSLQNQKESLEELRLFLEERADALDKQIKAGVEKLDTQFDLKERIMQVEVDIKNTSEKLDVLKLEAAINLGDERWLEMLELLNRME